MERPLSTRSHRSSSIATDVIGNTPCSRVSFSSNQDIPIMDRFVSIYMFVRTMRIVSDQTHGNNSNDYRLKRAAAQERRQATRKCSTFDRSSSDFC